MNFSELIKAAGEMKARTEGMKERLAEVEVTGEAGGGLVRLRMDGSGDVRKVEIDPSLAGDLAMVEDLVATAFADGRRKAEAAAQDIMRDALGGLPLPPGLKLPF